MGRKKQPSKGTDPRSRGRILLLAGLGGLLLLSGLYVATRDRTASRKDAEVEAVSREEGEREDELYARYAGSESCRSCHPQAFDLWKTSHHALAERELDEELDGVAFRPSRTIRHGSQVSQARVSGGRFEIVTLGEGGEKRAYTVERVLGVSPLRQFLIPAHRGRYQVSELAVDSRRNEWFDVFGDEDRQPGEWGHWTGRGMTWNSMCASCHNTRVRKNYDPETDSYSTRMAELGVGCESCHGPMKDHVRWQQEEGGGSKSDPFLASGSGKGPVLDTCGACHARRSELTEDHDPARPFLDQYLLVITDETEVYYPDGQVQEENYEYASFLSSRMYLAGVRCGDCHDPHSGRTRASDNQLCMRCHNGQYAGSPIIEPVSHGRHPPEIPGGRCVDCHMPETVYMQRHPRRDHGFTIPDPLLTIEYGIPNACNRCHADRDAAWALQKVEAWYGARMQRPSRARARLVARARRGDPDVVPELQTMARQEELPLWRGTATSLLKNWLSRPEVRRSLLDSLGDPSPLVRAMAARALEPLAQQGDHEVRRSLRRLLEDPLRAVRVEAAWGLRSEVDPASRPGSELWGALILNLDHPSGALRMSAYQLSRGDLPAALRYARRAVELDPRSPPLRHELAVVLSLAGQRQESLEELRKACRLAPEEAFYRFKLALAWNELGELDQAVKALQEAVRLDPDYGRAWYNLGLGYSAQEKPEAALQALARAEELLPGTPEVPYARATILLRLGRQEEAREAARRMLRIDPSHPQARHLLELLSH